MAWRLGLVFLVATLSVPLSKAQMRGAHIGSGHGVAGRIGRRYLSHRLPRKSFPGSSYLYPDLGGGYYSDEQYDEPYADGGPAPKVVIVEPAAAEDSPQKVKSGPLLIEWQGDRYVRFGGAAETPGTRTAADPDYAGSTITKPPIRPTSAAQKTRTESPGVKSSPVILVYRDGHREEIPDYAIANGIIYAHGTSWQNGYWTKQIPLSALDPPATMDANQQRGVKFMLPSAPNVVIASF
jgi:hypothetical protein